MQAEHLQDEYDDGLIRQIFRTTRAFSRTLNGDVADKGIHSSEWMILNLVLRNPRISQAELISRLGVEPASISRTLGRLAAKGLICREAKDKERGNLIVLTDEGRATGQRLQGSVQTHRQQALSGLTAAERQQLRQLMQRIEENLLAGQG